MIKRDMKPRQKITAYSVVGLILFLVLSPHIALTLLSFGTIWSFSVVPDACTIDHYKNIILKIVFL